MVLFQLKASRTLAASAILLASVVHAQIAVPSTSSVASPSPFKNYKSYTDEPISNWKAANDTAARIGGWREYARQAQQPDNTPAASPAQTVPVPTTKAKP